MSRGFTGRIARATASRPWVTIGVWLVALAGAIYAAGGLGDALTQEERVLVDVESGTVEELEERLRSREGDGAGAGAAGHQETVIVQSDSAAFGDAAFDATLTSLADVMGEMPEVESVSVPTAEQPMPVSADGSTALATVIFDPTIDAEIAEDYLAALDSIEGEGIVITSVGDVSGEHMFDTLAEEGLIRGEAIGIGVALLILLVVFGALVAAGIPLLVAIVSIVMAVGATALVGQAFELSFFVVNMITMMGLALGIDYSLVMVQRFREELHHGHDVMEAVQIAGSTANRAVLFSGITVVIALVGLLIVPSTIMRSLGAGAIVVAIMAVVTSLTLLPAVLRLLGHRVNKGRVPFRNPDAEPRRWNAIARVVTGRPVLWATASIALLALLAIPATQMRLTFPGIDALPEDNELRVGVEALTTEFDQGQSATVVVIEDAAGAEAQVEALAATIEDDPAFADTAIDWRGDVAFIDTQDVYDAADPRAEEAVDRLRDTVVPDGLAGTAAVGHVGGEQAGGMDFTDVITGMTPWVLLIVLGASFLLLLVAFRSVVVPTMAIVLNLLSAGAAFGLLVAVFQWGWGAELLGFAQVDGIAPWIPLFTFAVLFGLSMDYHVFLLSRIRERHDQGASTREAIAYGLTRTGLLITGAALIMVAVFGGFALGDLSEFAQMGFGLAAAVIIDATIVRSVVVPSVMTLLDRHNWYLPRWLEWLPRVNVEGEAAEERVKPEPALVPARLR
ncbi:MMPL family transporter [Demequina sp. NBRC 110053]|uniref:MMPL family transporter n=1 Tax=Demequina sp. NBRC 110053 TaxID=1570342 RepID=UPI001185E497|nr:MMPL family transporter [Demequina sp. NBRC 110053]